MTVRIDNGDVVFYQWDTGRYLILADIECCNEVHFSSSNGDVAYACLVKPKDNMFIAEVPNILLQNDELIYAHFIHVDSVQSRTLSSMSFRVLKRPKPESYIYDETEMVNYSNLSERILKLSEAQLDATGVKEIVAQYLDENPITAENVGALSKESLNSAIDTALSRAEENGAFKGDKGDTGAQGIQGIQGERGFSMYLLNESMAGSVDTFHFTSFKLPNGYTPKVNDLVLYKNGWLASIRDVDADNQTATVGAFNDIRLIGPAGATGNKGDKGDTGAAGTNGKDGISATHSWNGTTLTITSASGTSSANLKGEKGDKGDTGSKGDTGAIGPQGPQGEKGVTGPQGPKGDTGATGPKGDTGAAGATPVKGVDYWTSADQESIVQQVITALGTPVFGTVDANNNIILTGKLADGKYTIKYEDAEGEQTNIGTLSMVSYTNQIPISTDASVNVYNGTGYKEDKRMGSDGNEGNLGNPNAVNAPFITGFIPCKQGDVIRLKNCYIATGDGDGNISAESNSYGNGFWGMRSGLYNSSKAKVNVFSWGDFYDKNMAVVSNYTAVNERVTQFTIAQSGVSFMRITLAATGSPADAILTVNEPID